MSNDRLSFDLSASDLDTGFKLAPEGWAQVEIKDVQEQDSSNGNPQYVVEYKSLDERFTGTVRDYVTITAKAVGNILNLAKTAGFPVPSKEAPGKFEVPPADDLIGKEMEILIVHNEDSKGKTDDDGNPIKYANVKFAGRRPIGGAAKAPAGKKAPAKGAKAGGFSL